MPATFLFAGPLTSVQDVVPRPQTVDAKRGHMNASSATGRIMDWPLAGWRRKTDMRRRAKRFTLFMDAVVTLTKRQMTALRHFLEFKKLSKIG